MSLRGVVPVDRYYDEVYKQRSSLLDAFMKDTGLHAQQIEMHYDILGGAGTIWFEKKRTTENKHE